MGDPKSSFDLYLPSWRDLAGKLVSRATTLGDTFLTNLYLYRRYKDNTYSGDISLNPFLLSKNAVTPEFTNDICTAGDEILLTKGPTFKDGIVDCELKADEDIHALLYGANYSTSVLITALIYFDKAVRSTPSLFLRSKNVVVVFSTAFVLAGKFLEDEAILVPDVASCVEVPLDDILKMEVVMLEALEYNLWISDEELALIKSLL